MKSPLEAQLVYTTFQSDATAKLDTVCLVRNAWSHNVLYMYLYLYCKTSEHDLLFALLYFLLYMKQ